MRKSFVHSSVGLLCVLVALVFSAVAPMLTQTTFADDTSHPRLFFEADQLPTLRTQATTSHQEIWNQLRDYTNTMVDTNPPSSAPGDDQGEYRDYGSKLAIFALTCAISEEDAHCNVARRYLLAYASWDQWDEYDHRDLGMAHMLLGSALAYDWLYHTLTPAEQETVRKSLSYWAERMYETSVTIEWNASWNNWWSKSYMQNHHMINHSALGITALALLNDDPRAETWLDQAVDQMTRVRDMMNGIEDGTWHESISYQSFQFSVVLPFLVNLRSITGTDLLPHDYLRNYPYWRVYNYLSNGQDIMAFGDFEWSYGNSRSLNLLRFAASEYNNGYAEWLAQEMVATEGRYPNFWGARWAIFEFLHYDADVAPTDPSDLPTARLFPDLEGVIWRTGWADDDLVFGFKTGPFGGRFAFDTFVDQTDPWETPCSTTRCNLNAQHDHADTNTFYIYRGGAWLTPENVGWGKVETSYHNTILIDGEGQTTAPTNEIPAMYAGTDGFIETIADSPDYNYIAADATNRYKNIAGIEDVTRHVVFVRPDYFLMIDAIAASDNHQYEWVSHFGEGVSIDGNWVRGDATNDQTIGVAIAAPTDAQTETGNDGLPYVHIQTADRVDDVRFINLLYPTDSAGWETRPQIEVLADTPTLTAVRVTLNNGTDHTDDVILNHIPTGAIAVAGSYQYDGEVVIVSREASGQIDKLFVSGGTTLSDENGGRSLVSDLDADQTFQASYQGTTVEIDGEVTNDFTLYAPGTERLSVNGQETPFTLDGDYITLSPAADTPATAAVYLPLIGR